MFPLSAYMGVKALPEIVEKDLLEDECNNNQLPPFDPTEPDFLQAVYSVEKQFMIIFLEKSNPIAYTGHSAVFQAYSQLYRQNVAVKIINKREIPAVVAEKFLNREVEITSRAHHPHIVKCFSILPVNANRIAIVSEFCPGGTLSHLIDRENIIAEPNAARMFRQLVEAIQYLHDRNVAHRDIKLENILLDENWDVKLIDFGFARSINRAEKSSSFCGTKLYCSPSILRSKPYDAFAADWYAAGVVLYALVTGNMPCNPIENEEQGRTGVPFPPNVPSIQARYLIERLLMQDDLARGGYKEIVESQWIQFHTNAKWIMADKYFVHEMHSAAKSDF